MVQGYSPSNQFSCDLKIKWFLFFILSLNSTEVTELYETIADEEQIYMLMKHLYVYDYYKHLSLNYHRGPNVFL